MSSGSKNSTTTTQVQIPDEVKPLLSQYLQQAQELSQGSPSNQWMDFAKQNMFGATAQAYGSNAAATHGLTKTANGMMLNANPYFDQTVGKAMGDITRNYQNAVAPGIDATAARAGAFGGSRWAQNQSDAQRNLGDALGNTANSMYSGNYSNERQLQQQAQGLLPSVGQANMGTLQSLYGFGQSAQGEGANQLGILGQAIGVGMGGAGQSQTGANPNYRSPIQNVAALGGLLPWSKNA